MGFIDFVLWFVFGAPDSTKDAHFADSKAWIAVAFATVSAVSFAAFVLIDLSAAIVARIGFGKKAAGALGLQHGWGTLVVIVFGAFGAWLVSFFAVIIEMLQTTVQAAVLTGIAWQVVYAQIIDRAGAGEGLPGGGAPTVEQTVTEEEEDGG